MGHATPEDGSEPVDDSEQLPTPRDTPQPKARPSGLVPLDTLFSFTDIVMESNDTNASWMRTADSGNPLFTMVDWSGIFNMEIVFCVCTDGAKADAQLLQSGLFPATFKQIETIFTHSVLDDFLRDNLECKTTAQQYYSKLQMMTSKMFPNTIPVRFSSFEASHLINIYRIGISNFLGHPGNGETSRIEWIVGLAIIMMMCPSRMVPWLSSAQCACSLASIFRWTGRQFTHRTSLIGTLEPVIYVS